MQSDLFSYTPPVKYPLVAGHRNAETSIEAAQKVDAKAGRKQRCYDAIVAHLRKCGAHGATTHELSLSLPDYDYAYIQPRTSELSSVEMNLITYRGERRKNAKGNSERVWVLV